MTLINVDLINVDRMNLVGQDREVTAPLTAAQAAAPLGVKRATLYAYVSRGLLGRTVSLDGRSSLFDPADIDRLRTARRRPARGELRTVISSGITELSERGHHHRGVEAASLVELGFEAAADHIWQQTGSWTVDPALTDAVGAAMTALPETSTVIDRYRVAVAVAAALDPVRHLDSPDAHARAGRSMIGATSLAVHPGAPVPGGRSTIASPMTANRMTNAVGRSGRVRGRRRAVVTAVDAAMVLLADHGLAGSTFAARIAASVRADPYSIVSAGLGAVGGVLHGAASHAVHTLLDEIERADRASSSGQPIGTTIDAVVGDLLANGRRLPGVGHAIYVERDPREDVLLDAVRTAWSTDRRLGSVETLRATLTARSDQVVNVDFALGALTWLMGAPPWAGEAIFAQARIVGWIAHGIEEFGEVPMRFRPTARYVPGADPDALTLPDSAGPTGG